MKTEDLYLFPLFVLMCTIAKRMMRESYLYDRKCADIGLTMYQWFKKDIKATEI